MKKILLFLFILPVLAQGQHLILTGVADPAPNQITITGTFLPFSTVTGNASDPQFVGISGTGLSTDITIPIQTGFETSKDGSTWTMTTLTYAQSGGIVTGQFFWARVKSTQPASSLSGSFVASSSPAVPQNIGYSALISPVPALSGSPSSITNLNGIQGTAGTTQTITATFVGLAGSVLATAPTNTEVSKDGGFTFASTQPFNAGSPLALQLRTTSTAPNGPITGNFVLHSIAGGPADVLIGVTGTVSTSGSSSDTARFAMSLTVQTVPNSFVSLFGDPFTGVRSNTNPAGNITISTVSTGNWKPLSGGCAGDAFGQTGSTVVGFPDNILKAQMYTASGGMNLSDSATLGLGKPQFTISGLNPSKTYHIEATGNLDIGRFGLLCTNPYWAKGSLTTATRGTSSAGGQTINFLGNTSAKIVWTSITPDVSGTINIYIFTLPGQDIGVIGGIEINAN